MKLLKGLLIGVLAVIIGGVALTVGCAMLVDDAIQEVEQQEINQTNEVKALVDQIEWTLEGDYIVGYFTNKTGEEIDYLEFEYKLYDGNGATVFSSFVNETDIAVDETRKIKIDVAWGEEFKTYEIKLSDVGIYDEELE